MFLEKEVRAKFCIITRSKHQLSITYQCLKNLLLKKIIMIEVSPQVPFVSCIGRACSDHPVTQFRLSCGQDYLPHSRNCDGLTTGLQMNALETLSQGPATCSMSSLVTEPETVKVVTCICMILADEGGDETVAADRSQGRRSRVAGELNSLGHDASLATVAATGRVGWRRSRRRR